MIKVVLWDVDGTLLNFEKAEEAGIRKCFGEFGLGECTGEMLRQYSAINRGYWKKLERGAVTRQQVLLGRFEDFFNQYGLNTSQVEAFNDAYQKSLGETVCFSDNAKETLLELKGRVLQCAVTNGSLVAQRGKLSRSGMDQIFDEIFISEVVGVEKPNRQFFDFVFQKIGHFDGESVLIVGDSLTSDIQGGVNAGIQSCWFNPNGMENDANIIPDYEIKNIRDVLAILKENGN